MLVAENFSSDAFPALTTAPNKWLYFNNYPMPGVGTLGADEKLFVSSDSGFIYDNVMYGSTNPGKKIFAVLDDNIAIFPDKYCFSHKKSYYYVDSGMLKSFNADYMINDSIPLISLSDDAPQNAKEGDKYFSTFNNKIYTYIDGIWTNPTVPDTTKFYSIVSYMYQPIDSTFVWDFADTGSGNLKCYSSSSNNNYDLIKITFYRNDSTAYTNFSKFSVGDKVAIFGLNCNNNNYQYQLDHLSVGTEIVELGYGYIVVKNTIGLSAVSINLLSDAGSITIKRIVPSLDCAVSVGDRIWGAKGSVIYACAPHNILSWGEGNSLETPITFDSGIPGDIIGCANYAGVPVFFTENAIIKVVRVYNGYKISVTPAASLSKNNPDSLALVSGSLYYVSDCGIMKYSGASPQKLDFLPDEPLKEMVAGTDGNKYYLSGKNFTYIYDPTNNTWYTDTTVFSSFARYGSYLAGITSNNGYCFICLIGDQTPENSSTISPENKIAVFAPFYENTTSKKTYSKVIIKALAQSNTKATVKVSFDGNEFIEIGKIQGNNKIALYEFDFIPQRADYMQVKIEALNNNNFTILSLTREFVIHDDRNRSS